MRPSHVRGPTNTSASRANPRTTRTTRSTAPSFFSMTDLHCPRIRITQQPLDKSWSGNERAWVDPQQTCVSMVAGCARPDRRRALASIQRCRGTRTSLATPSTADRGASAPTAVVGARPPLVRAGARAGGTAFLDALRSGGAASLPATGGVWIRATRFGAEVAERSGSWSLRPSSNGDAGRRDRGEGPVRTETRGYPLESAGEALADLRAGFAPACIARRARIVRRACAPDEPLAIARQASPLLDGSQ